LFIYRSDIYMKKVYNSCTGRLPHSISLKAQNLIREYGNSHITTSAISFTPDGKYMLVGGYARLMMHQPEQNISELYQEMKKRWMPTAFQVIAGSDNKTFLVSELTGLKSGISIAGAGKKPSRIEA